MHMRYRHSNRTQTELLVESAERAASIGLNDPSCLVHGASSSFAGQIPFKWDWMLGLSKPLPHWPNKARVNKTKLIVEAPQWGQRCGRDFLHYQRSVEASTSEAKAPGQRPVIHSAVLGFDLVLGSSWLIKQLCVGSHSWRHIEPDSLKKPLSLTRPLDSQHWVAHKQLRPVIYFALISRYNMKGLSLSHWILGSQSSQCWQPRPESAWKRRFVHPLTHTYTQTRTRTCT